MNPEANPDDRNKVHTITVQINVCGTEKKSQAIAFVLFYLHMTCKFISPKWGGLRIGDSWIASETITGGVDE